MAGEPRGDAVNGPEAGTVLEQKARPEADPVRRPEEQPRHRGRRHFHGRGSAVAAPAQTRAADHALVGLDLDLDEGGLLGAVRRIGLPALCADACIRGRVELFGVLLEPRPLGAAVAGRATLLAALAFRARLVLLFALAPEQLLRQHGPGRAEPRKLGFQRLDPVPRRLRGLAQPGVLPGQGLERRLLAPRSSQGPAEIGIGAGQRLRQRLPDCSKPGKPGFRRLAAGPGRLRGLAQPGILLAQPFDRRLLASRPPQDVAQVSGLVRRQLRQRRPGRPKLHNPGLQLLLPGLGDVQGVAQPEDLVGQRPGPGLGVAQYPDFPVQPKGLAGQLLRGVPDALRPLLLLVEARVQPGNLLAPPHYLPELAEFRAKRPDGLLPLRRTLHCGAPRRGLRGPRPGRALAGLRRRQGLAQPGVLPAQRLGRVEGRGVAGFGKERLQARHFGLQGRHVPCRAASFLRLLLGLAQPAPASLEPRLPRTGIATGGHLRPAQLFTARFRRLRPRPFPLIHRRPVARHVLGHGRGGRPHPAVALDQRQAGAKILLQNRHALDDSACRIALPAPLRNLDSLWMMSPKSARPRPNGTFTSGA